jgi:hypothetical protein
MHRGIIIDRKLNALVPGENTFDCVLILLSARVFEGREDEHENGEFASALWPPDSGGILAQGKEITKEGKRPGRKCRR